MQKNFLVNHTMFKKISDLCARALDRDISRRIIEHTKIDPHTVKYENYQLFRSELNQLALTRRLKIEQWMHLKVRKGKNVSENIIRYLSVEKNYQCVVDLAQNTLSPKEWSTYSPDDQFILENEFLHSVDIYAIWDQMGKESNTKKNYALNGVAESILIALLNKDLGTVLMEEADRLKKKSILNNHLNHKDELFRTSIGAALAIREQIELSLITGHK